MAELILLAVREDKNTPPLEELFVGEFVGESCLGAQEDKPKSSIFVVVNRFANTTRTIYSYISIS